MSSDKQNKAGWVSPQSDDWNDSYTNGEDDGKRERGVLVSDESSHEGETFARDVEEYFTTIIDQSANEGLFDPSSNVDTTTLSNDVNTTSQCNVETPCDKVLEQKQAEDTLVGVHQLTLDIDQTVRIIDILTPRNNECCDLCLEEKSTVDNVCNNVECNNAVKPVVTTSVQQNTREDKVVDSARDEETKVAKDSEKDKKGVNGTNKLFWVPKGSTPSYMSKSEESKKRIELARRKAKSSTSEAKNNKAPAFVKDEITDVDSIRMKIAANAKAAAEAKAAIVLKEKQRVLEGNKARKEAREKYIKEAREHLDSIKAVNRGTRTYNAENKQNPSK